MAASTSTNKPDPDARCPVCDSRGARLRYRITHFRVYDCTACKLVYLWPRLDEQAVREMFTRLYTEGEGSVPELRSYYDFTYEDVPENPLVQLYERWLARIESQRAPGRILDIGCGTGLFLAVARRRGWKPHGIDDCAEATAHARSHFGLEIEDGEFAAFAAGGARFDAVTMWDVIEHARQPVGLLEAARGVLAPGGVVAISTPNQQSILDVVAGAIYRASGGRVTWPLEKFYIEQHFLYFTPATLNDALARARLAPVLLERELTDLRRLTLSPLNRLALNAMFAVSKWTGLENRLFALARARS
jgi:2-polyprenyl-3-methyl-5-hydroxy-6-metoxy-1,4-benzoquinol methylase